MFRRSTLTAGLAVTVAVAVVAAGAALAATSGKSGGVTLTLWHNYGTQGNAVATGNLVKAFEKQNPNITIKVVSQPSANYFQLLSAAWIAGTAPDLSVEWTGLFDTKYQSQLLNLKSYFTSAELNKINGVKWVSSNFDPAQGLLVMPLEDQFYMGFYNKALFSKAGVTSVEYQGLGQTFTMNVTTARTDVEEQAAPDVELLPDSALPGAFAEITVPLGRGRHSATELMLHQKLP